MAYDFAKESKKWRQHRESREQNASAAPAPVAIVEPIPAPAPVEPAPAEPAPAEPAPAAPAPAPINPNIELEEKLFAAEQRIQQLSEQHRVQSVMHTYEKLELTNRISDLQLENQKQYDQLRRLRSSPVIQCLPSDDTTQKTIINLRSEVAVKTLEAQNLREKVVLQNQELAERDELVKMEVEAALALITMGQESQSQESPEEQKLKMREELKEELKKEMEEEKNNEQKNQKKHKYKSQEVKDLDEKLMELELVCDDVQKKVYDMLLVEEELPDDVPDFNIQKVKDYVARLVEKMERLEAMMEEKVDLELLGLIRKQVATRKMGNVSDLDLQFGETLRSIVTMLEEEL